MHISEWQYIFQSSITYFRAALHISEETVCTRCGHGENDQLELYEDGELGTRPARTQSNSAGEIFTVLDRVFFLVDGEGPFMPHGRV